MLIAGGRLIVGGDTESTCYFKDIYLNEANGRVKEVREQLLLDMPIATYGSFTIVCHNRVVRGGGQDENDKCVGDVIEFDDVAGWKPLPSLKARRSFAGACVLKNTLIVGGGVDSDYRILDTIEMLYITEFENSAQWTISKSKLPTSKLQAPTLSELQGKIILIDGNFSGTPNLMGHGNALWEGTLLSNNEIQWKELPSMKHERFHYFSIVIEKKLFVFGGISNAEDEIEVFDGAEWESGPRLPLFLTTKNAQAVVDNQKRIIITSNYSGIIVINTIENTIEISENHSIDEKRQWYGAISR